MQTKISSPFFPSPKYTFVITIIREKIGAE